MKVPAPAPARSGFSPILSVLVAVLGHSPSGTHHSLTKIKDYRSSNERVAGGTAPACFPRTERAALGSAQLGAGLLGAAGYPRPFCKQSGPYRTRPSRGT